MIRINNENNPLLAKRDSKYQLKNQFENKTKIKQSAFKIVSRVDKLITKKVIEIKKMSQFDLDKYNIIYSKDRSLVDKLFEFRDIKYQGKKIYL